MNIDQGSAFGVDVFSVPVARAVVIMYYRKTFIYAALVVILLAGCDGGTEPDGQTPDPLEVVWTYQT